MVVAMLVDHPPPEAEICMKASRKSALTPWIDLRGRRWWRYFHQGSSVPCFLSLGQRQTTNDNCTRCVVCALGFISVLMGKPVWQTGRVSTKMGRSSTSIYRRTWRWEKLCTPKCVRLGKKAFTALNPSSRTMATHTGHERMDWSSGDFVTDRSGLRIFSDGWLGLELARTANSA